MLMYLAGAESSILGTDGKGGYALAPLESNHRHVLTPFIHYQGKYKTMLPIKLLKEKYANLPCIK
jgi:hypothetical protein